MDQTLGVSLGVHADTLAKILQTARTRTDDATGVQPGDVLLVDEAGMACTRDLDDLAAAQSEELQARLADISTDEERNQAAMKADADLKAKRQEASYAAQSYRDQTKLNKLKTKYIIRIQSDRGDVKASEIQKLVASKV